MSKTTYTSVGPFVDNGAPGIDHNFLNGLEAFCASGWFDSAITSNGSGILATLGNVIDGQITLGFPGSAQTLTNGSTITLTQPVTRVTNSGNVTGIIMTAGSVAGQLILLYNASGTGLMTFAASGSNVRQGNNVSIAVGRSCWMLWDGSAWTPTAGA